MFTNGKINPGHAGDMLSDKSWQYLPAAYVAGLLMMNIVSIPFGTYSMIEECPDDTWNCDKIGLDISVPESELHAAMEEWANERSFTTTFNEGHIVDRTPFMQFPDDVIYVYECGSLELLSQSRIGQGDMGVNSDRLDDIKQFLEEYDFSEIGCQ